MILGARPSQKARRRNSVIFEYLVRGFLICFIILLIRWVFISPARILSEAMWPTLHQGDFVLVSKLPFGVSAPFVGGKFFEGVAPSLGSIVICDFNGEIYSARVVGVSGDKVSVEDGVVFRNEESQQVGSINEARQVLERGSASKNFLIQLGALNASLSVPPVVIPPGYVFLIPDNRIHRDDVSRYGLRPAGDVIGKVFYLVMSFQWNERPKLLPQIRSERVFQGVD